MMSWLLTSLVIYDLRSLSLSLSHIYVSVCLSVSVCLCLQYYKSRQSTAVLVFPECLLSQGRESARVNTGLIVFGAVTVKLGISDWL